MVAQRLGYMLHGVGVRHSLTLLTQRRCATLNVPLARLSVAPTGVAVRTFSLWSGASANSSNENARKAVFERAEELATNMSKHENGGLIDAGTTVHDRLVHAESALSSAVHHESEAISHAAELASSDMKALGLGGYSPSGLLQQLLDGVQYYTNLPWWATIVLVTCGIRFAVAPLIVYVQGNSIRLSNIQPQMQDMIKDLEYAKATGNQQEMQNSALKVRKLLADNNCSPFKSLLLPVVQMPVFLSFYFALSGLANAPLPALTTGGGSWFPDLTAPDPYYILPAVSTIMTLIVLETGAETGTTSMNNSPQARLVKNILRGVTVIAAWFISSFPSALLVYWSTTNTFSLFQLLALRTRFFKRLLRLPEKIEHPVRPHVREKSFMENIRSGMNSARAMDSATAPRRAPPSALYRKPQDVDAMSSSRSRALDSLMAESSGKGGPASRPASASSEQNSVEKQSRVMAARERRLRQRH